MMRTVLVTGGTTRLGKVIADYLRAHGWRVFTSSHRAASDADIVADLADPTGPDRLFAAVCALNGGIPPDALVNNAALFTGTDETLRRVNFESPRRLAELMARREKGCGCVVNILDCRVLNGRGTVDESAYCAAKRNLLEETRASAARHRATLRVNGVAPGPVMAPVGVREKAGLTPFGRPTPEQVAAAVAFLLSAESTSGCVIPVDGGQSLLPPRI